jgi:hypothetical protein
MTKLMPESANLANPCSQPKGKKVFQTFAWPQKHALSSSYRGRKVAKLLLATKYIWTLFSVGMSENSPDNQTQIPTGVLTE